MANPSPPPVPLTDRIDEATHTVADVPDEQDIQQRFMRMSEDASKIHDHTSDIQRYAQTDLLGQAIEGVGSGLVRTVVAFKNDLPWQGSAELVRLGGAAFNLLFLFQNMAKKGSMFAKWAGPIGSIVGEALAIIAAIFEQFNPQTKSMADELKEALAAFQGRENLDRLEGLLDSFALGRANLIKRQNNSMSWDDVCDRGKLMGSVEIVFLGAAESFLRREKDTENEVWPEVFASYLYARNQAMQNLTYALLAMRKHDAEGLASEDTVLAASVFRELLAQCRDFLDTFGDVAVGKGAAWFIGTDGYFRQIKKVAAKDATGRPGNGTRLATAGDSGHVFHIGDRNEVFVWADEKWNSVKGLTITEIAVVEAGTSSFHVFGIDASGKIGWKWWGKDPDPNAPTASPFAISANTGRTFLKIAATANALYAIDSDSQLHMIDRQRDRVIGTMPGNRVTLLSADVSYVYLAASDAIWRKAVADIPHPTTPWELLSMPTYELGGKYDVRDISACADGSLQMVNGDKMFSLFNGTWTRLGVDVARAVVKVPFRAYEQFQALKSSVTEFEKNLPLDKQAPTT